MYSLKNSGDVFCFANLQGQPIDWQGFATKNGAYI